MFVLHGSWLPAMGKRDARFAIWGEVANPHERSRRQSRARQGPSGARLPRHPFGATAAQLCDPLLHLGVEGRDDGDIVGGKIAVHLPSSDGAPLPSPDLATGEVPSSLHAWQVDAQLCHPALTPRILLALDTRDLPMDVGVGDDLHFWGIAARVALEMLYRQRFVPTLDRDDHNYVARWKPLLDSAMHPLAGTGGEGSDRQRLDLLARTMPPVCRALAWQPQTPAERQRARAQTDGPEPQPRTLLLDFLSTIVDAIARQAHPFPKLSSPSQRNAGDIWLGGLQEEPVLKDTSRLSPRFHQEYKAWATPTNPVGSANAFRVCFRLSPPAMADAEGTRPGGVQEAAPALSDSTKAEASPRLTASGAIGKGREPRQPAASSEAAAAWKLEYLLQATDDPSLLVPATEVWRRREATASFLNRRLDNPQEHLLVGLGQAARVFPPIEASLRATRPEGYSLTTAEAHDFVREKALLLRSNGFGVLVPNLEVKLGVRVSMKGKGGAQGLGTLAWGRVVDYDWQVMLGDEPLSQDEFKTLASLKEPLVQLRGRWIELRPEQVERALAFFAQRKGEEQMGLSEALRLALAPDGEHGLPVVDVVTEGWLDELVRSLGPRHGESASGEGHQELAEPDGFVGQLRPYQRIGLSWLASLRRYGLGACLADDMGLGKTIQIIAVLLLARHDADDGGTPREDRPKADECSPATDGSPALLVCPTSVVGNWRREIERFAPSLRVLVHHGAGRTRENLAQVAAGHDIVVSTYALLHRDEELAAVDWSAVILDEAQNIKNASTKAARMARRLRADWRAALTGTPVENRLADLWSIFQFLNPGYLGSGEEFKRRFTNPIERLHDPGAMARLGKLVAPFILRRVKTDPAVISDLPEKNEMKVLCNLTKEQATLYAAAVEDSLHQIEEAEETGLRRRGLVLATLAGLKQVCDHPALFLKDRSELGGRSGKLNRLGEMLEEVLSIDERSLIFTQYAEMGKLLVSHLEERFGRGVLFLHGGTPAEERDRMVALFQAEGRGPHLFVLSLKAGGTGLNLTAANHVFHFDRWWNAAIEDQATDRAFRIGQRRNVQVHKFVSTGTVEEAIDDLIERKQALAGAIVGTSEAWLTELSTAELRELFALRTDAVGED